MKTVGGTDIAISRLHARRGSNFTPLCVNSGSPTTRESPARHIGFAMFFKELPPRTISQVVNELTTLWCLVNRLSKAVRAARGGKEYTQTEEDDNNQNSTNKGTILMEPLL